MSFRRICLYSTFEHYARHAFPIVEALNRRGNIRAMAFSSRRDVWWGEYMHPRQARELDGTLWMTCGSVDSSKLAGMPQVYVEHGSGQTYDADERSRSHASYSTGVIPDAKLFICPNHYVATRRRRSQPGVPSVVAGAPILDEFIHMVGAAPDEPEERVAVIAFHWDCQLVPESRSAFDHYAPHLVKLNLALRRKGIILAGHAHPRIAARARRAYERAGIAWLDYDEVMSRASVLVVDNSSIGYEFAALRRPVVWLNAPWYRKDVHHGLRFWECIPGEQADDWQEAVATIERAMIVSEKGTTPHDPCVDVIYPVLDGRAADRAAEAIELLV